MGRRTAPGNRPRRELHVRHTVCAGRCAEGWAEQEQEILPLPAQVLRLLPVGRRGSGRMRAWPALLVLLCDDGEEVVAARRAEQRQAVLPVLEEGVQLFPLGRPRADGGRYGPCLHDLRCADKASYDTEGGPQSQSTLPVLLEARLPFLPVGRRAASRGGRAAVHVWPADLPEDSAEGGQLRAHVLQLPPAGVRLLRLGRRAEL
mmetsp:Transcript_27677/g.80217  ORF Transcript_27677/g.80217 Transcript_27677/m.80217 type:complete len:204 (-) Transcript_27677:325-936(-)